MEKDWSKNLVAVSTDAIDWQFSPKFTSHVGILTANAAVLGGGASGGGLR